MKNVHNLAVAVQKAELAGELDEAIAEIKRCFVDKVDPFELFFNGTKYTSPFEIALHSSNYKVVQALLEPFKQNTKLLLTKLSQNTDNLDLKYPEALHKQNPTRVLQNFLQEAILNSSLEVFQLICGCFGNVADLKTSKILYPIINRDIEVHHAKGAEIVCIGEVMIYNVSLSALLSNASCSIQEKAYARDAGTREQIIDFLKTAWRFYSSSTHGVEQPICPNSDRIKLYWNCRVDMLRFLLSFDGLDAKAITSRKGKPLIEFLNLIANKWSKIKENWILCVKNIMIVDQTGNEGYIRDDGKPVIIKLNWDNLRGEYPLDFEIECRFDEPFHVLEKYLAEKAEIDRARHHSFEARTTAQVADLKGSTEAFDNTHLGLDHKALEEIRKYRASGSGEHSGTSQEADSHGSGKKHSPTHEGKKSPQENFYVAVRDSLKKVLKKATSTTDFHKNKMLQHALLAASYGGYALSVSGVAAPAHLAISIPGFIGQRLQEADAQKKVGHLVCTIKEDSAVDALDKVAVLVAWKLAGSLAAHIDENSKSLDKICKEVDKCLTQEIKMLAKTTNKTNIVDTLTDYVSEQIQNGPNKKAGCVIS